jgi:hypothetical protein
MTEQENQENRATAVDAESLADVEAIAAEAQSEEQAEQRANQTDPSEWEDGAAQEEQARALAKMGVQGVEMAAGLIRPGHTLDSQARASGEESLLPVARDFSGEVPEWLRPYMHYLAAGLWIGGVLVGAYKGKREDDAERERQTSQASQAQPEGVDGI